MLDAANQAVSLNEEYPAFRYHSGRQVWDEAIIKGRYMRRYVNCNGQILPTRHVSLRNIMATASQSAAADGFGLSVNGKPLREEWALIGMEEVPDTFGYQNAGRVYSLSLRHPIGVEAKVFTRLDGSDFIIRWLEIKNDTDSAVALTQVSPLSGIAYMHDYYWMNAAVNEHTGSQQTYRKEESIAEGALYSVAYNHMNAQLFEGDFYFQPMTENCLSLKTDLGKSGFARPAFWLRDNSTGETMVCEFAYGGNWQFKAMYTRQGAEALSFELGMLQTDGEVLRVLQPSQTCTTPAVHVAFFHDDDDTIVQSCHDHVRHCILPPLPHGVPVSQIEGNHRGYITDNEDEKIIRSDMEVAQSVGAELYVIDAGWYGARYPNHWWENAGDWQAGPWLENGLEPLSAYAHELGMRFGLWMEIEAFGAICEARGKHPEFLMLRHGGPCAQGRAINLADPKVEAFCLDTIDHAIQQYHMDLFRIDHNHNIGLGGTRVVDGFTENTSWLYYEAFERIFSTLRQRHPDVIFQNCASGGGRLDWATMRLFHNTELSDWIRMPRGVRILSGDTMSLPPEILLRSFGLDFGEAHVDGDLKAQLRLCAICRPRLHGIAPKVEELTPYLRRQIDRFTKLFHGFMLPLLQDCKVYHHTPFQPVKQAAPYTIFEYASPDRSWAMIAVFCMSEPENRRVTVYPRGLLRSKTYRVTFDNAGGNRDLQRYASA